MLYLIDSNISTSSQQLTRIIATPRPKKASYGHHKGGYKWEL